MKKLLTSLLLFLCLTGCKKNYTNKEVRQFEKGDTIYVCIIGELLPAVVIKNDTVRKVITIKRPNKFDGDYDNFRMEDCYNYRKF